MHGVVVQISLCMSSSWRGCRDGITTCCGGVVLQRVVADSTKEVNKQYHVVYGIVLVLPGYSPCIGLYAYGMVYVHRGNRGNNTNNQQYRSRQGGEVSTQYLVEVGYAMHIQQQGVPTPNYVFPVVVLIYPIPVPYHLMPYTGVIRVFSWCTLVVFL